MHILGSTDTRVTFDSDFTVRPHFRVTKWYSKSCVKRPLSKRQKVGFHDQLSFNAGQKYCRMLPFRMLQGEHSAILSTFIKPQFVIKIFVLSIAYLNGYSEGRFPAKSDLIGLNVQLTHRQASAATDTCTRQILETATILLFVHAVEQ